MQTLAVVYMECVSEIGIFDRDLNAETRGIL